MPACAVAPSSSPLSLPAAASLEPYLYTDDGERLFGFTALYLGDPAEGEKIFAPLLAVAKPSFNSLGAGAYAEWQTMLDGELGHGKLNYLKSGFIVEMTPDFIDAFVGNFEGEPRSFGDSLLNTGRSISYT